VGDPEDLGWEKERSVRCVFPWKVCAVMVEERAERCRIWSQDVRKLAGNPPQPSASPLLRDFRIFACVYVLVCIRLL